MKSWMKLLVVLLLAIGMVNIAEAKKKHKKKHKGGQDAAEVAPAPEAPATQPAATEPAPATQPAPEAPAPDATPAAAPEAK